MSDKPIWPYVVITVGGIVLLIGAIVSLVMVTRKTGIDQWWWAFQAVLLIMCVSVLVAVFGTRQ